VGATVSPKFRIELPLINYLPGEMVTGRVVVTEPGHSRRLEISLTFWEVSAKTFTARPRHVPGSVLHTGKLQLDTVMPFSIRIPADALPNAVGPHGVLFWAVEVRSHELGPDTTKLAAIRVQSSHPAFIPEHGWSSGQPRIHPEIPNAAQLPQPGEAQPTADQGKDAASRDRPVRGSLLALFGVIGMLLWGGAGVLELFDVVAFGENASPIGQAPTIAAAVVGSMILAGVPYQAVAQAPPESRVRRVPGFCWLLLIGCMTIGFLVIAVRTDLTSPLVTSLILLICFVGGLTTRKGPG
jgi:hypothetical protein